MWPTVLLKVTSDQPLPARCTVTYSLAGIGRKTVELDVQQAGSASAILPIKVQLPSDVNGPLAFKLESVDFGDGRSAYSKPLGHLFLCEVGLLPRLPKPTCQGLALGSH